MSIYMPCNTSIIPQIHIIRIAQQKCFSNITRVILLQPVKGDKGFAVSGCEITFTMIFCFARTHLDHISLLVFALALWRAEICHAEERCTGKSLGEWTYFS